MTEQRTITTEELAQAFLRAALAVTWHMLESLGARDPEFGEAVAFACENGERLVLRRCRRATDSVFQSPR